ADNAPIETARAALLKVFPGRVSRRAARHGKAMLSWHGPQVAKLHVLDSAYHRSRRLVAAPSRARAWRHRGGKWAIGERHPALASQAGLTGRGATVGPSGARAPRRRPLLALLQSTAALPQLSGAQIHRFA